MTHVLVSVTQKPEKMQHERSDSRRFENSPICIQISSTYVSGTDRIFFGGVKKSYLRCMGVDVVVLLGGTGRWDCLPQLLCEVLPVAGRGRAERHELSSRGAKSIAINDLQRCQPKSRLG